MTATARCARTLLVIAAALVAARCARYEEIWSGVRVERDGTIRLVADEPFCACVDLVNRSGAPVELRSRLHGVGGGRIRLRSGERQRVKFDWAGSACEDVYTLEVFSVGRKAAKLDARSVLSVYANLLYRPCEQLSCEFGPLSMNAGTLGLRR